MSKIIILLRHMVVIVCVFSCLVVSNSLQSQGLYPTRLLCPWDYPSKSTGVGCHFLLQKIFLTQGSKPCLLCLLHLQIDSLLLSHKGSPFFPDIFYVKYFQIFPLYSHFHFWFHIHHFLTGLLHSPQWSLPF